MRILNGLEYELWMPTKVQQSESGVYFIYFFQTSFIIALIKGQHIHVLYYGAPDTLWVQQVHAMDMAVIRILHTNSEVSDIV